MNDHAAVNEYAPYCALILLSYFKGIAFRIPAPSRLPPIDPDRVIGGLRRSDVTYKAWVTRACARFADLNPGMVSYSARRNPRGGTSYDFTATDAQREALEAYVMACNDEQRYVKVKEQRTYTSRGKSAFIHHNTMPHPNRKRPLLECSPSRELVLSMLTDKLARKKLESSNSKAALTAAILSLTRPKASTVSAPASELLAMLSEHDCPQQTLLTCARLRTTPTVVPVGHIMNAATMGWWQRVDVLLDHIERTTRPPSQPLAFPEITQYMLFIAARAIMEYLSLPMPDGRIVLKHRTFAASSVAPLAKKDFSIIWKRCEDQRVTAGRLGAHVVKEFAKSFGFKTSDGRVFFVTDEKFSNLVFHVRQHKHLLTEKPQ